MELSSSWAYIEAPLRHQAAPVSILSSLSPVPGVEIGGVGVAAAAAAAVVEVAAAVAAAAAAVAGSYC